MFLPTLHFKHVSCWRFICSSFPRGDSICQHPSSCKWEGAGRLCHHQGLGDGDRDKGQLLSRDWAVTPGHSVREGLNGGVHTFFPCSMQSVRLLAAVGSERSAGSNQAHQWDQGPCRTRKWPQPGASHLSGLHIKSFLNLHFLNVAALLNLLFLPRSVWKREAQILEKTFWLTFWCLLILSCLTTFWLQQDYCSWSLVLCWEAFVCRCLILTLFTCFYKQSSEIRLFYEVITTHYFFIAASLGRLEQMGGRQEWQPLCQGEEWISQGRGQNKTAPCFIHLPQARGSWPPSSQVGL